MTAQAISLIPFVNGISHQLSQPEIVSEAISRQQLWMGREWLNFTVPKIVPSDGLEEHRQRLNSLLPQNFAKISRAIKAPLAG